VASSLGETRTYLSGLAGVPDLPAS
jgi:hypothetical protein